MKTSRLNIWLLAMTLGLFSLNFTPAFAQQMLLQVVGGGYRLQGPAQILFNPVTAGFTLTESDVSIRDMATGYLSIEDQNGGSEFQVQVEASSPLTNTSIPTAAIGLDSFLIKNISGTGNDIDTMNGRTDGLSLVAALNDFYQDPPTNSIPNDLTVPRVLATGTGQQPGEWRFYPGFRIQIPSATAIGVYETTLVFTII